MERQPREGRDANESSEHPRPSTSQRDPASPRRTRPSPLCCGPRREGDPRRRERRTPTPPPLPPTRGCRAPAPPDPPLSSPQGARQKTGPQTFPLPIFAIPSILAQEIAAALWRTGVERNKRRGGTTRHTLVREASAEKARRRTVVQRVAPKCPLRRSGAR